MKTNIFAILSIIFAFIIAPLGLIFGIIALVKIKRSKEKGSLLAIIGILFSCLFLFIFLLASIKILYIVKRYNADRDTLVYLEPEDELDKSELMQAADIVEYRLDVYGFNSEIMDIADDTILIEIDGQDAEDPFFEELLKINLFQAKIGKEVVFQNGKDIIYVCRSADCSGIDPISGCDKSEDVWACRFRFAVSLSPEAAERIAKVTEDLDIIEEHGSEYLSEKLTLHLGNIQIDELFIGADLKGRAVTDIQISGSGAGATQQKAVFNALENMKRMQTILMTGPLPANLEIVKVVSNDE